MLGLDLTRSPHPRAVALLGPFVSGIVFMTGFGYFRSDLTTRLLAYPNLDHTAKLAIGLIVSYATGVLLSIVISTPFIILLYLCGAMVAAIANAVSNRKSGTATDPSQSSVLRRTAEVVLGPSSIPRSPEHNAADFTSQIVAAFKIVTTNAAPGSTEQLDPIIKTMHEKLSKSALDLFKASYDQQWQHIHKALHKLEQGRRDPTEGLLSFEPALSIASAILVWRFLLLPVPSSLHIAALTTFVVLGIAAFLAGVNVSGEYSNGTSVVAFLFEEILDLGEHLKTGHS